MSKHAAHYLGLQALISHDSPRNTRQDMNSMFLCIYLSYHWHVVVNSFDQHYVLMFSHLILCMLFCVLLEQFLLSAPTLRFPQFPKARPMRKRPRGGRGERGRGPSSSTEETLALTPGGARTFPRGPQPPSPHSISTWPSGSRGRGGWFVVTTTTIGAARRHSPTCLSRRGPRLRDLLP